MARDDRRFDLGLLVTGSNGGDPEPVLAGFQVSHIDATVRLTRVRLRRIARCTVRSEENHARRNGCRPGGAM